MIRTIQRTLQHARVAANGPAEPTTVRPVDAPHAFASGPGTIRVLLAGGDILTGWGVRTHDLGVTGHLARALHAETGRGADVGLALNATGTMADLLRLLRSRNLDGLDAIVLHLGLADVQLLTRPRDWATHLRAVIKFVLHETSPRTSITLVGIPTPSKIPYLRALAGGVLDDHAQHLNHTSQITIAAHPRVSYLTPITYTVSNERPAGRPDHYLQWARHDTAHLIPLLQHDASGSSPVGMPEGCVQKNAAKRLAAIRSLDWGEPTMTEIRRTLAKTKQLFDVDTVTFTIATTDTLIHHAHIGLDVETVPLEGSFCEHTLQQAGTTVITDTWADTTIPRRYPSRFYAGHPIHAPDGTPIATLCLLAEQPPADDLDTLTLENLAHEIQHCLHTTTT